jgi:hypothetical protein
MKKRNSVINLFSESWYTVDLYKTEMVIVEEEESWRTLGFLCKPLDFAD